MEKTHKQMDIEDYIPKKRKRIQIKFDEPTKTKQEYKDDVNINNIIKKYKITGELPVANKMPRYEDVSKVPDYRTALDVVNNAQMAFKALPASLRQKFRNDPAVMLDWSNDPANQTPEALQALLSDNPLKETSKETVKQNLDEKKN